MKRTAIEFFDGPLEGQLYMIGRWTRFAGIVTVPVFHHVDDDDPDCRIATPNEKHGGARSGIATYYAMDTKCGSKTRRRWICKHLQPVAKSPKE